MKSTERDLFFYDLKIHSRADHAIMPPIEDIMSIWRQEYENDRCTLDREQGSVKFILSDIQFDEVNFVLTLLVRRISANSPNAAYGSFRQIREERVIEKEEDEGGARAAHIFISTRLEVDKPNTYLCLLEGVQELSHRHVEPLLNRMTRNAQKNSVVFSYPDPSNAKIPGGKIKIHPFIPFISLRGHPSEQLLADIAGGQIQHIDLINEQAQVQIAGGQFVHEKSRTLRLGVTGSHPWDAIVNAIRGRGADYPEGRLVFKTPAGDSRTVEFVVATGTPEQARYVKREAVRNIDPPLNDSALTVREHFANICRDKLIRERRI